MVSLAALSHSAARNAWTGPSAEAVLLQDDLLSGAAFPTAGEPIDRNAVQRFYKQRHGRAVWSGSEDAARNATTAVMALSQASEDGLDPTQYHLPQLHRLATGATGAERAAFDVLLTDAVLRYATGLRLGRVSPAEVYSDVSLPPQSFDAVSSLEHALSTGSLPQLLSELAPVDPEYARLKEMLAHYRRLASSGDWPVLPAPATRDRKIPEPRLALLRERLDREQGNLPESSSRQQIIEALKLYQARNGLAPDGVLGPRTIAMLNVQPQERVAQITANMERWRWLPHVMEARYVMINVADATLRVVDKGNVILRSKVIVGETSKPTPMLRAAATEVTVNPVWNVPDSIARREILPKLKRNPYYLAENHMVLINGPFNDPNGIGIQWKSITADAFPYRIRQLAGDDNALGKLKLEMASAFNVYLHDTPARRSFDRAERNLSHGCIRVQEILPLASIALTGDSTAAIEQLKAAIATGETKRLRMPEPIPVYVLYWTATSNEDGTMGFRRDVYGRDQRLISSLKLHSTRFVSGQGCSATG